MSYLLSIDDLREVACTHTLFVPPGCTSFNRNIHLLFATSIESAVIAAVMHLVVQTDSSSDCYYPRSFNRFSINESKTSGAGFKAMILFATF